MVIKECHLQGGHYLLLKYIIHLQDLHVLLEPCANHLETTWKPCGGHVKTTWKPCGGHVQTILKTMWGTCANHVQTMWKPHENHVGRQCRGGPKSQISRPNQSFQVKFGWLAIKECNLQGGFYLLHSCILHLHDLHIFAKTHVNPASICLVHIPINVLGWMDGCNGWDGLDG